MGMFVFLWILFLVNVCLIFFFRWIIYVEGVLGRLNLLYDLFLSILIINIVEFKLIWYFDGGYCGSFYLVVFMEIFVLLVCENMIIVVVLFCL